MSGISFGFGKSKSNSGPPSWQVPYLKEGLRYGQNLLRQGAYEGDYYADIDPRIYQGGQSVDTGAGYLPGISDMYTSWGQRGSDMLGASSDFFTRGMNEGFYNPNDIPQYDRNLPFQMAERSLNDPTLQRTIDSIAEDMRFGLGKQFAETNKDAVGNFAMDNNRYGLRDAQSIDDFRRSLGSMSTGIKMGAYDRGYGTGENMMQNKYGVETGLFSGDIQNRIGAAQWGGQTGQWGMGQYGMVPDMYYRGGNQQFGIGEGIRGAEQNILDLQRQQFYEPWNPYNYYMQTAGQPINTSSSKSINVMGSVEG